MPAQWYYCKQLGPVSSEQLKQLALSGQVKGSDLIWKEGMTQWASAGHIHGLFPDGQTATLPPLPPVPTPTDVANTPKPVAGILPLQPSAPQSVNSTPASMNPTAITTSKPDTISVKPEQPHEGMTKAAEIGVAALGGAVVGAVAASVLGGKSSTATPRSGSHGDTFVVVNEGVAGRRVRAGGPAKTLRGGEEVTDAVDAGGAGGDEVIDAGNAEETDSDEVMDAVEVEDTDDDEVMDAGNAEETDSDEVMDAVEAEDTDDDEVMDAVENEEDDSDEVEDDADLGDDQEDELDDGADEDDGEDMDDTDDVYDDGQDDSGDNVFGDDGDDTYSGDDDQ